MYLLPRFFGDSSAAVIALECDLSTGIMTATCSFSNATPATECLNRVDEAGQRARRGYDAERLRLTSPDDARCARRSGVRRSPKVVARGRQANGMTVTSPLVNAATSACVSTTRDQPHWLNHAVHRCFSSEVGRASKTRPRLLRHSLRVMSRSYWSLAVTFGRPGGSHPIRVATGPVIEAF